MHPGWTKLANYDTLGSAKTAAKTVGGLDNGVWMSINSTSTSGHKTFHYACAVCVDLVTGSTRCKCSRALRVVEDLVNGKCEVLVSGLHIVVTDTMKIDHQGRGLPALVALKALPFISEQPGKIVDHLERS